MNQENWNGQQGKFMILLVTINYTFRSKGIEDIQVQKEVKNCKKMKVYNVLNLSKKVIIIF